VKYVGLVALAATFWLSVATVRLLMIDDDCPRARRATESRTPSPPVEIVAPPQAGEIASARGTEAPPVKVVAPDLVRELARARRPPKFTGPGAVDLAGCFGGGSPARPE
jgi:hypothetical protein